jgi:two-component system sensor histidine kinase PilS (NtrC family)
MVMAFRMAIIITLLGSAILIQLVSRTILPINPLYFLIFLTSFFTLAYGLGYRRVSTQLMAYFQTSGDLIVITLLLYFTGAVRSPFSFLYLLVIIYGSILLYRRGSLFIASVSSIAYGTLVDLLYYGIIPYYDMTPAEIAEISNQLVYYYIFLHLFAFYTTAILSSYLSERLRTASTELREIDEDLSDLRLLHQKIIDSMSTGLAITDLDGFVNFVNEAGVQILGRPAHQVIQQKLDALFVQETDLRRIKQVLGTSKVFRMERNYMKGPSTLLIGMNLSFLHSKKGQPYGFIVIFQDITELHKMEQQFRMQERMAAIGTMAAGIAHEIRNPLAAIHGSVQVLKNELSLSDDQKQLMEIVLTESTRLNQTVTNFLNYAKPKQLSKRMDDLKRVVADTLAFIEKGPDFLKDRHSILFNKSSEDFLQEFDGNQIRQVIWNLSINALHSMPVGGTLKVTLEHDLQGNAVLTFADQGRGIERERLSSIFDPYQKSTTGGSGLGMAIVYRIIEDHRGLISIDSKTGSGTTVTVRLPAGSTSAIQPLLQ